MEEQTSIPSRSEHGGLLMKLHGTASITLDTESRSSTSLAQHFPRIWECPCRRWRNRQKLLWKRTNILMEGRTPLSRAVSHGLKPLARRAQGRSSTTTSFLGGNLLLDCVVYVLMAGAACTKYVWSDSVKVTSLAALAGGGKGELSKQWSDNRCWRWFGW